MGLSACLQRWWRGGSRLKAGEMWRGLPGDSRQEETQRRALRTTGNAEAALRAIWHNLVSYGRKLKMRKKCSCVCLFSLLLHLQKLGQCWTGSKYWKIFTGKKGTDTNPIVSPVLCFQSCNCLSKSLLCLSFKLLVRIEEHEPSSSEILMTIREE